MIISVAFTRPGWFMMYCVVVYDVCIFNLTSDC